MKESWLVKRYCDAVPKTSGCGFENNRNGKGRLGREGEIANRLLASKGDTCRTKTLSESKLTFWCES